MRKLLCFLVVVTTALAMNAEYPTIHPDDVTHLFPIVNKGKLLYVRSSTKAEGVGIVDTDAVAYVSGAFNVVISRSLDDIAKIMVVELGGAILTEKQMTQFLALFQFCYFDRGSHLVDEEYVRYRSGEGDGVRASLEKITANAKYPVIRIKGTDWSIDFSVLTEDLRRSSISHCSIKGSMSPFEVSSFTRAEEKTLISILPLSR